MPVEICELINLHELLLGANNLEVLPPEIGKLVNLRTLWISGCNLIELPSQIGNLIRLQSFTLAKNRLTFLPVEIGELANVRDITLNGNRLESLPRQIGELTNLKDLRLHMNRLTSLPSEIGQLANLRYLTLYMNQLTFLPPEIGQLTDLQTLTLNDNQLTSLPPEIGQLTNLQTLTLSKNQLPSLPSEIGQLTKLPELTVDDNRLTSLPPEIGQLTNLQTLTLSKNQLPSLLSEIGQLTKLRELTVDDNRLTSLPPEIGQLTNLQTLRLSKNQLTSLPSEIGQLTKLRELTVDDNRLTSLPPEIGQLTNLQTLRLSKNQLTSLPSEIGQLTKLRELTVDDNRLTSLPPEIGQLTNLQTLTLSENQLTSLPSEIGQLTKLRELTVDDNRLTSLPPEIGQLPCLRLLRIEFNRITIFPSELADLLSRKLALHAEGNPLQEPISELINRGSDALVAYLRSLEDAIPQYEAKVLLVGEGNVGKTSLLAALLNEPFIEKRETTHGIEIRPLIMRHPDIDVDMTIRAWDFGGQELYRITHQFFYSRRAVYLVVWNAREGQESNEVDGWLRRIRLRVSRDARALIVATHTDERRPELDYPFLEQNFPILLAGRYEIDNRSGHGIDSLREGIAAEVANLPQMGQLISPRWIAVRDEVITRARTEPQITYEQFAQICSRHGVVGDEINTLAELLHDLGQIIYYGEDEGLKDFVILNAEWLTKAISYVLEDIPTREADGVLDHAHLKEIWQDRPAGSSYPARYHPYFLRLMEKFDVSYRLADNEYRSLVAQLVPRDRPELPWDLFTPPYNGVRSIVMVCRLSEPVPGLMAWLTVRHHHASTGKHWRTGVFLRDPIAAYSSEALMELRTPTSS